MAEKGISRAKVCQQLQNKDGSLGIEPQGWSSRLNNPKWSTILDVCRVLGIKPAELFQSKEQASSLIECPHCHNVIKLKTEKV